MCKDEILYWKKQLLMSDIIILDKKDSQTLASYLEMLLERLNNDNEKNPNINCGCNNKYMAS